MAKSPGSPVRFECPACGGRIKAPPGQAGQKVRCPRCDAEVIAPAAAGAPAAEPPATPQVPQPSSVLPRAPGREAPTPPAIPPTPSVPVPAATPSSPADSVPPGAPATPAGPPARTDTPAPKAPVPEVPARPDVTIQAAADVPVSEEPASEELTFPDTPSGAGMPPPRPRKAAPPPVESPEDEFGIACPLCQTRVYVRRRQIGKQTKCPDCHTMIPIKSPPPKAFQPATDFDDGDDLQLSELFDRPESEAVQRIDMEKIEREIEEEEDAIWDGTGTLKKPVKDVARDLAKGWMSRAKEELKQREGETPKLPAKPLLTGLFKFVTDPVAIVRMTSLSFGLVVLIYFAGAGFMAVAALPVLLILTAVGWAHWLSILQDSANGLDRIESWPGLGFLDWLAELLCPFCAGIMAAAPGLLLGLPLSCLTGYAIPVLSGLSFFVLFPILLLSTLEEGSPLGLASPMIWTSVVRRPLGWLLFYGLAFVITSGRWPRTFRRRACDPELVERSAAAAARDRGRGSRADIHVVLPRAGTTGVVPGRRRRRQAIDEVLTHASRPAVLAAWDHRRVADLDLPPDASTECLGIVSVGRRAGTGRPVPISAASRTSDRVAGLAAVPAGRIPEHRPDSDRVPGESLWQAGVGGSDLRSAIQYQSLGRLGGPRIRAWG